VGYQISPPLPRRHFNSPAQIPSAHFHALLLYFVE